MGQERLTGLLVWLRAQHCLSMLPTFKTQLSQ